MEPTTATQLLRRAVDGDAVAADQLLPLVYDELRALARRFLRGQEGHTLQPTALVHEAWLHLVEQSQRDWRNRAHFFAVAARIIRRVLVDHARMRASLKRRGDRERVKLEESAAEAAQPDVDLLALDEALHELAQLDARQARVVELRFFAGLEIDEVALALGVSPRTVKEDWRVARAFLSRRLAEDGRR